MITYLPETKQFHLSTSLFSYLLRIDELGLVVLDYYGAPLHKDESFASFIHPSAPRGGRYVVQDDANHPGESLLFRHLEFSTPFVGWTESPSIELSLRNEKTFEFVYVDHQIGSGEPLDGLPTPKGGESLVIGLEDRLRKVRLELLYRIFEEGVLTRAIRIINDSEETVTVHRASSYQLTFPTHDFILTAFVSSWGGEWQKEEMPIQRMGYHFGSETGSSCDSYNPCFYLRRPNTTLDEGEVYAFTLMYSGSHREEIQTNSYGYTRLQAGISPLGLAYLVEPGGKFESPWGILTYSQKGINGIPEALHPFASGRILPSFHKDELRPIVYNNWEGTYFDFSEAKLLSLASKAKRLGMECFVLDDGWFGHRDNDSSSLGDYSINKRKLPRGLRQLSDKIHQKGLLFGLWVEPESVSEDSELFKNHPDWVLSDGVHAPKKERHQWLLDLTKVEVRDYLFQELCKTFEEAKPDFIKWDFNRILTDYPEGSGYVYRYYLALYSLLHDIREKYPRLWMENCASGGARNDYAMMGFFDHAWVSDNTDHYSRAFIQTNMGLFFPQRWMSCHVSAKTSHKMLRRVTLDTKFDVASFGVLGYELDLKNLEPIETKEVQNQIAYYKERRSLFQMGSYSLLEQNDDRVVASIVNDHEGITLEVSGIQPEYPENTYLRSKGLDPDAVYRYEVRKENIPFSRFGALINQVSPIRLKEEGYILHALSRHKSLTNETFFGTAYGSVINGRGILLPVKWSGGGIGERLAVMGDFGTRLYYFRKVE